MTSTTSAAPVLDIQHLSVDYGEGSDAVRAVSDVSLTLRRGEILGLAGESGSGKSTLVFAITQLLRPPAVITGGEALYYPRARDQEQPAGVSSVSRTSTASISDGAAPGQPVDILRLPPAALRAFRWNELAIVFQSAMNALNPIMPIGEQIVDVMRAHRPQMNADERKRRAMELLRLVGIAPDRIASYPHELSGGMRQRACIAIALALNPDIIIMDEPTTALDVVVQREILNEVMRLREQFNFTVLFITHDLSLLLEIADRVAIMYAGRIVEQGTQHDLYQRPRHPYSYGLIHSFPSLRGPRQRAIGIPGSPPDLRAVPSGCAFHPRCPFAMPVCTTTLPILLPQSSAEGVSVACHLYDSTSTQEPPTAAEMGAAYEALAKGSQAL